MLGPAALDLAGGNEHQADGLPEIDQLQGAVVMGELVPVGVGDGHVLEEGEVDGAVGSGESGELDSVHGYLGSFGLKKQEVSDNSPGGEDEKENCGHYTRS